MKKTIENIVELLGEHELRGKWLNFRCPYHNGDSFKFGVDTSTGVYSCWVCGVKGTVRNLLLELKERGFSSVSTKIPLLIAGISRNCQNDTSSSLLKRLNCTGPSSHVVVNPGMLSESLEDVWVRSSEVFREEAIKYLQKRGVEFGTKFACLSKYLLGRVVIPFYRDNKLVYYQARSYVHHPLKMLNPDEIDGWTIKSKVIWGYDDIVKSKIDKVFLTEGIFDSYSVKKFTGVHSVPLLGKSISKYQTALLRNLGVKNVVVFLDSDANLEAVNLARTMYLEGFKVKLVLWDNEDGSDPGSINKFEMDRLIENAVVINNLTIFELSLVYGT